MSRGVVGFCRGCVVRVGRGGLGVVVVWWLWGGIWCRGVLWFLWRFVGW